MKTIINIALFIFMSVFLGFGQETASFKTQQLKNKRVKDAYANKWKGLEAELKSKKINPSSLEVFIRIFKKEKELELWVKNKSDKQYVFLKKIAICASSGELGPKRKEGDYQVPEGIYDIPSLNPNSNYFLALLVGYPNKSDRILKKGSRAGGDIMIHGNCVTIGCIPLQDEPVKDVYMLCVEAKNNKSEPRVEIYPCKFTPENIKYLNANFNEDNNKFWTNLKPAYTYFEENKMPSKYSVNTKGEYVFSN
ncbi:MAG TPA: L,D-transpeptidase family protein [Bacteroidia bacterium]|nr:L,D-transpeptidase family protein [Bacteroidia bacterium]